MYRAFLSCVLFLFAAIAPVGAAEPIHLRLSTQFPNGEPFMGPSVVQFKEEVERETGGAVTVEIFDKSKLYIDNEVVDAVKSGAVEMGLAGLNQITKAVPAAGIMEQPFMFNFDALVRAATAPDSEMRKLIDDAVLKALGVRVLWWQTIGQQVLYTKNGDVRSPDRIKDQKIRAFSRTMASFVKYCGGVPLNVSSSKVYDTLQDGTLDIAMISIAAVRTRDLWKVTSAITKTDHGTIEFVVIINEKSWQLLSDDQKAIVLKAARKTEAEIRARAVQMEAAAYDFAREKGMKIFDLSQKEVAEWRACSADVFTDFLETGGELTKRLMRAYAKLRLQPCCGAGPATDGFKGQ
jgi:C4-dicarboxylate-binding protein DctP